MYRLIQPDREHSLALAVLNGGCPVIRTFQVLITLRLKRCLRVTETRAFSELLSKDRCRFVVRDSCVGKYIAGRIVAVTASVAPTFHHACVAGESQPGSRWVCGLLSSCKSTSHEPCGRGQGVVRQHSLAGRHGSFDLRRGLYC